MLERSKYFDWLKTKGDSTLLVRRFLNSPEGNNLWKIIEENNQTKLPILYDRYGNLGLHHLIVNEPESEFLKTLEEDPSEIINIGKFSSVMAQIVEQAQEEILGSLDVAIDSITKGLNNTLPMIHEKEYKDNFNNLFNGYYGPLKTLSKEETRERANLIVTWLSVAKSTMTKVLIVNDDGETLFTHPGLMGKLDVEDDIASWGNFGRLSKLNGDKHPRLKKGYQEDFINKFDRHLSMKRFEFNKEELKLMEEINKYFNEEKQTIIQKEDDWDLFE